jgi:hypothetical protein
MATEVEHVFEHAFRNIEQAEIIPEPFPHIVASRFVPDAFFEALVINGPEKSEFRKVFYPGVGFNRKTPRYHEYGWAYQDLTGNVYYKVLRDLFASEQFSRALLTKFSRELPDGSTPIPPEKHPFFKGDVSDYSCVFDFQIDLPGYEIPPHLDVNEKIVTF